jgi:hypothetical protein
MKIITGYGPGVVGRSSVPAMVTSPFLMEKSPAPLGASFSGGVVGESFLHALRIKVTQTNTSQVKNFRAFMSSGLS